MAPARDPRFLADAGTEDMHLELEEHRDVTHRDTHHQLWNVVPFDNSVDTLEFGSGKFYLVRTLKTCLVKESSAHHPHLQLFTDPGERGHWAHPARWAAGGRRQRAHGVPQGHVRDRAPRVRRPRHRAPAAPVRVRPPPPAFCLHPVEGIIHYIVQQRFASRGRDVRAAGRGWSRSSRSSETFRCDTRRNSSL
jgi:hypothetical protein